MRSIANLIPAVALLVACSKAETPAADTAVAVAPAPAAPAVVAVSEADVAGTWTGTSTMVGSDSVIAHWTQVCAAGSCKGTSTESKMTINSSYVLAGDSAVGTSQPFENPEMKLPKGTKIIDTWTVHFNGTNATGTGAFKLASKPDSVVSAYTFTGSKKM